MSLINCIKGRYKQLSLCFVLFCFVSLNGFAQDELIEDLLTQLTESKKDTNRVNILNDLCWEYSLVDSAQSVDYGYKAIELGESLSFDLGVATAYRYIGRTYTLLDYPKEAQENLEKGLEIYAKIESTDDVGKVENDLGSLFENIADYPKALEHFYNAVRCFEKTENDFWLALVKLNMANVYSYQMDEPKMLSLCKESIVIFEKFEMPYYVAIGHQLQGVAYSDLKKYNLALSHYVKALEVFKEFQDYSRTSEVLNGFGIVYQEKKEYEKAIQYYYQSLEIDDSLGNNLNVSISYSNIATVKLLQGKKEESTLFYDKSIELAKKTNNLQAFMTTMGLAAEAYYENGQYKLAHECGNLYNQIKDSLFSQDRTKQIVEIQEEFEAEKREQEIKALKADKAREKAESKGRIILLVSLVVLLLLVLLVIVISIRQRRALESKKRIELEQKALRSQMNPHFIFNSLNSIQRMYLEGNEDLANDFMADFSQLLRRILENSGKDKISLKEEVEATKLYLELEQMRTGDLFEYTIDVDSNIDQLNSNVPPLIIQPFVENAIWHGIVPKDGKGNIGILITRIDEGSLECIITDDGIGVEKSRSQKSSNLNKSKGVEITTSRLGGSSAVHISQRDEGGTIVRIKLNYSV